MRLKKVSLRRWYLSRNWMKRGVRPEKILEKGIRSRSSSNFKCPSKCLKIEMSKGSVAGVECSCKFIQVPVIIENVFKANSICAGFNSIWCTLYIIAHVIFLKYFYQFISSLFISLLFSTCFLLFIAAFIYSWPVSVTMEIINHDEWN